MTGTPIARVKGVSHRYGATGALGARAEWPRSGGAWRVEPVDEFDEHVLEAGVVVDGVLPDERDHLPIATVRRLALIATTSRSSS